MTRRCSHCSQNGHNSRTCPSRGIKLFGVRLMDGSSIWKSASMGNLSQYSGSNLGAQNGNGSGSPGEGGHDHADDYASEDFVPRSSSSRERKKGDVLDRGQDELAILSLLRSLDIQAKANGGAFFQVNGNHETINVEGDFRYVESGGFD